MAECPVNRSYAKSVVYWVVSLHKNLGLFTSLLASQPVEQVPADDTLNSAKLILLRFNFAGHQHDTERTLAKQKYNPALFWVLSVPCWCLYKVNLHVVWSALQNSMCLLCIFWLIESSLDPSFCDIFVCARVCGPLQFMSICWWHAAGSNHAIDGLASCPVGRRNTPEVASPNRTRWESSGLLRDAPVKVSQISVCSFFSYMYSPEDRRFRRFAM